MRGSGCCSQSGWYWGLGVGGGKGSAVKGHMEAQGFMIISCLSTGVAVETKEKGECRRNKDNQVLSPSNSLHGHCESEPWNQQLSGSMDWGTGED